MAELLTWASAPGKTEPETSRTVPVMDPVSCACDTNGRHSNTSSAHRRKRAAPGLPMKVFTELIFCFIRLFSERIWKLGKPRNWKAQQEKAGESNPVPAVCRWSLIGHPLTSRQPQ